MGKSRISVVLISIGLLLCFVSCEKKTYQTIEELDSENINEYIVKNNLNVQRYKNTDLYYQIITPGTGNTLNFDKTYPIVYTVRSLDGLYMANDTLAISNRYLDFMGYFPFGSSYAGRPNSPVERQDDLKYVVKEMLQQSNGQIRIIVPSRLTGWGRKGNRDLGIPPNASMDYIISVYDNLEDYEDGVIRSSIERAGFSVSEFTKTSDNIYYKIFEQGTGDAITSTSIVKAKYTLKNPAGTQLETNDEGLDLNLGGGTISAWPKIIPLINVGGKIRFFTPSKNAYGPAGNDNVSPFLSLDFEVEIIE
ncbi:MAG TPA: FKBP-type peptidyl-prolyl cis-trans isomerase [Sphingobacteriaceae bacterium]|nr:FKBP-type peptidyl-prolyl cis-trans isomerase [Sphingobacteriaceae bacterium]